MHEIARSFSLLTKENGIRTSCVGRLSKRAIRLRTLWAIAVGLSLTGCASTQLKTNTLDVAGSVASIYRDQALSNLSSFIDDPANALPSQVDISTGQIETINGINPSLTLPLGNQVVKNGSTLVTQTIQENVRSLVLGVSAQWNQSWTVAPVSDGNALRRLRALYRFAVAQKSDTDDAFKTDYLALGDPDGDGNYSIDISRIKGTTCVICMSDSDIKKFLPPSPNPKARAVAAQQTNDSLTAPSSILLPTGELGSLHANKKLKRGWLYWKSASQGGKANMPGEAANYQPLGLYSGYDLAMTKQDYDDGVLGNFLLFLLPQADPRLPLTASSGSPGGGSK